MENTPAMLDAWQAALGGDARPAALRDVLLWDAVGESLRRDGRLHLETY